MSCHNSSLKNLLSPSRSGTFFAPFRSRSANPDGFDAKMKLWIGAIEEWAILNKKTKFSLADIHKTFVSDSGIRPDKECLRLVFSEMKRRLKIVPSSTLKNSRLWTPPSSTNPLTYIDPKSWFGWGVTKFVYNPATWAISTVTGGYDQTYSDLTDMSITDTLEFTCQKSLDETSQNLLMELIRISKAEKQFCFEWTHLLELVGPILSTLVDATDSEELLNTLNLLMEYLAVKNFIAMHDDDESKLVKIRDPDNSKEDSVAITKKDIATARLLRAREFLKADVDKYDSRALKAKEEALELFNKRDVSSAKSLLRSHHRHSTNAEQKRAQLENVDILLDQLENTESNAMILRAYKDGAEALKIANTPLQDDLCDITLLSEAQDRSFLIDELEQKLSELIVCQDVPNIPDTEADLEEPKGEEVSDRIEDSKAETDESNKVSRNRSFTKTPAKTPRVPMAAT